MPGGVIGKQMLSGYAGTFAREADCIIVARMVKSSSADIAFGEATYYNAGELMRFGTGGLGTLATFAGFAVREVKQAITYPMTGFDYKAGQVCDVLQRGSLMVECKKGTPAVGGDVFVRIAANGGDTFLGGLETAADGGNTVALTNCKWNGTKDSNNIAELVVLSRVNP